MRLDRLLSNISVHVEPFALCQVSNGWRLGLPGPAGAMFHFVLQGSGILRGSHGENLMIYPYCLAVVPQGAQHSLECGLDVRSVRTIEGPPPPDAGIVMLTAGSDDMAELQVACGIVHVAYGDSLGLFQNLGEVVVADLSGSPQVRSAFEGILAEQGSNSPGSAALTSAYMNQCLVHLLRHLCADSGASLPWLSALEDPSLSAALDTIMTDIAAPHTVESLADAATMSRSTFSEHFRHAFGCTPMTFLRDMRLRRAAQLLSQSGLSIDKIAGRVGFSSRSHFSQVFTARFGMSPAHYRSTAAQMAESQQ